MTDNDNLDKRKKRGPTTCKKFKKFKKKAINASVEFCELSWPIGKNSSSFMNYIGALVRVHVDINIDNWNKVNEGLKTTIWEDVKKEFNLDEKMKEIVLKIMGTRWRNFKTRLVTQFITSKYPTYDSQVQLYDYLSEKQWEKFKKNHESDDFKAQVVMSGRELNGLFQTLFNSLVHIHHWITHHQLYLAMIEVWIGFAQSRKSKMTGHITSLTRKLGRCIRKLLK